MCLWLPTVIRARYPPHALRGASSTSCSLSVLSLPACGRHLTRLGHTQPQLQLLGWEELPKAQAHEEGHPGAGGEGWAGCEASARLHLSSQSPSLPERRPLSPKGTEADDLTSQLTTTSVGGSRPLPARPTQSITQSGFSAAQGAPRNAGLPAAPAPAHN